MTALELVAGALLVLGATILLLASAGVVRFPDFYTRAHAAGKADTLGQGLIFLGLGVWAIGSGDLRDAFKILLLVVLIHLLNPTATHALARSAWVGGLKPLVFDAQRFAGEELGPAAAKPPPPSSESADPIGETESDGQGPSV